MASLYDKLMGNPPSTRWFSDPSAEIGWTPANPIVIPQRPGPSSDGNVGVAPPAYLPPVVIPETGTPPPPLELVPVGPSPNPNDPGQGSTTPDFSDGVLSSPHHGWYNVHDPSRKQLINSNSNSGNSYPTASRVWSGPQGQANVIGNQQTGAPLGPSTGSSDGGCFITTAVCSCMSKPDDCEELQTLRKYRDKFLVLFRPDSVKEYYRIAPHVVKQINKLPDAHLIWQTVHQLYIVPAVSMIKAGRNVAAFVRYKAMVEYLRSCI
jgi:hypothetical protein